MSEVVWVACISAGVALATALMTQILATRAANRSADRADTREALQWQRSEQIRQEELQREDAQAELAWRRGEALRKQELRDARLQELWGHVLTTRRQMQEALERVPIVGSPKKESPAVSLASLPASAAAHAYSVALLFLADVRASAKAFYVATSELQLALMALDESRMHPAVKAWNDAYRTLEIQIAALAVTVHADGGQSASEATVEPQASA